MILRPLKVQPCWRKKVSCRILVTAGILCHRPKHASRLFCSSRASKRAWKSKVSCSTDLTEGIQLTWMTSTEETCIDWNLMKFDTCVSISILNSISARLKSKWTPICLQAFTIVLGNDANHTKSTSLTLSGSNFQGRFLPSLWWSELFPAESDRSCSNSQHVQRAKCLLFLQKKIHHSDKTQLAKSCEEISVTVSIHYWHLKGLGRLKTWQRHRKMMYPPDLHLKLLHFLLCELQVPVGWKESPTTWKIPSKLLLVSQPLTLQ